MTKGIDSKMTVDELLNKHNIKHESILSEKGIYIFSVGSTNVLFWINEGNSFKMKRDWFKILQENCEKYILCLYDRKNNKYYYIKFPDKSNWLSGSFNSCGKEELFLGKQVLNNQSTIGNILVDLKKKSI